MLVSVMEVGDRPNLWTKARRYAPAAARLFGEILGEAPFATSAEVVLDWDNQLGLQPAEVAKPVLFIRVTKKFPEYFSRNVLYVDVRLNVDSVFGTDTMTAEAIYDTINELKSKVEQQVTMRKDN